MLKPESILEIPDETKTIAQKAFPKGIHISNYGMNLVQFSMISFSKTSILVSGNPLKAQPDWLWSQSCNIWKTYRTGKRLRQSAAG